MAKEELCMYQGWAGLIYVWLNMPLPQACPRGLKEMPLSLVHTLPPSTPIFTLFFHPSPFTTKTSLFSRSSAHPHIPFLLLKLGHSAGSSHHPCQPWHLHHGAFIHSFFWDPFILLIHSSWGFKYSFILYGNISGNRPPLYLSHLFWFQGTKAILIFIN